jgi:hypothetical protein
MRLVNGYRRISRNPDAAARSLLQERPSGLADPSDRSNREPDARAPAAPGRGSKLRMCWTRHRAGLNCRACAKRSNNTR